MLKRSSIIVSFILVTCLAAGGVEFFCRALGQALVAEKPANATTSERAAVKTPGKTPGRPPAAQVGKAQKVRRNVNYSIITKRSLFGKIEKKEIKKETAPAEPLKATKLDLVLLGTVSGDGNVQRAIIQQKRKKTQDIYYKGDAVGSAIIKEVKRGEIILTVNGKDEILLMEELKSSQKPDKVRPPSRKKKVKPPRTKTKAAIPIRKITLKTDDTQETDQ